MIDKAVDKLGYGEEVYELVKEGIGVLRVKIGVGMDDGWVKILSGYGGEDNDGVGGTKGGIRFERKVSEKEVKAA